MARYRRFRRKPVRRSSEVSRALERSRSESRLTATDVGRALGVHPRTIRRWEIGESQPRAQQWPKVLALYAARAPKHAAALAASSGRTLPVREAAPVVDAHVAARVVAMAADALDVAPRRVRDVLRAAMHAAAQAGVPFAAFASAVVEEGDGVRGIGMDTRNG
jgi:DNA-binding transcriptional regulator YiaG